MPEVIVFRPREALSATENMREFVRVCRETLTVFGDIDWQADTWDVSDHVRTRSGYAGTRSIIRFSDTDGVPFPAPFSAFAKAYLRYTFGFHRVRRIENLVMALRVFRSALNAETGTNDVTAATASVFNAALALAKAGYATRSTYKVATDLQAIARFLHEHRLTAVPFQWRHHLRSQVLETSRRVGAEADQARRERMPSLAALDALPKCFRKASTTQDILVTSAMAVLCACPSRISELFSLPADCEVNAVWDGKERYGLRWFPAKGAEPMVKWISPSMAPVVREAIGRLRNATMEARTIAAWYVTHPKSVYLPPGLDHLRRREWLDTEEIRLLTGLSDRGAANTWLRSNGVPCERNGKNLRARFADVERTILSMLPRRFPVADGSTGLRYDEALLVVRLNETHGRRTPSPCMIQPLTYVHIKNHLKPHAEGQTTIFQRMGFAEPDGSLIVLTSHQLRHWLNTLAHRGGMSQIDIAKWSGRKDIRQNAVYDHLSAEELMRMVDECTADDANLFGPVVQWAMRAPVSREEFIRLQFPTAHVTEIGFCVHDFSMLPCQMHRDCVSCEEHVCVKGDAVRAARLRERLQHAEQLLAKAATAMLAGTMGADRWHSHHLERTERLRQLVAILDNPDVEPGTIIKLASRTGQSTIGRAMADRGIHGPDEQTLPIRDGHDGLEMLLEEM